VWKSDLWKDRKDIPYLSIFTLEQNKIVKSIDIKRYEKTAIFFAIKYRSFYYGTLKEEIVGVNSGAQCGLNLYRSRGLWVHPKHRGLGLSTWLLKETIKNAEKRGCENIWSYPKLTALYAYLSVGFERKSYFDHDNCVVTRPVLL
tara:strand:- start:188 stop:622 length:435 start_codon:yes stop_codon:yes gene_type:complete